MLVVLQLVLVVTVIGSSIVLMRGGSNARHLAVRRILLVFFSLSATFSIFFPRALSTAASWVGIGRGTDLLLYGLVVFLLIYMATTYQRFREVETSVTRLARRLAIDEATKPWQLPAETDSHGKRN